VLLVHEHRIWPERSSQFIAAHEFARFLYQRGENAKCLLLEPDSQSRPAQFGRLEVKFERTEADEAWAGEAGMH
jgi:hypothetical protein